jgi:hypothetical protein
MLFQRSSAGWVTFHVGAELVSAQGAGKLPPYTGKWSAWRFEEEVR